LKVKELKVLITIPHVFAPEDGSIYSSRSASKKAIKGKGLEVATLENLCRHGYKTWIHASLGKYKPVVTREIKNEVGVDLKIRVYTVKGNNLIENLIGKHPQLEVIAVDTNDYKTLPILASRNALEEAEDYDIIGYMEDDILIEDNEFFDKINYLVKSCGEDYAFIPHRCEFIPYKGDVILSGDPDGGRPDLFWDTGERLEVQWALTTRYFYRATNPHSGCYFLSRNQALRVKEYWEEKSWICKFQLSGPLEQAGSGILLPVLKIMKPIPIHYKFLMVRHQDQLWKRHPFERK